MRRSVALGILLALVLTGCAQEAPAEDKAPEEQADLQSAVTLAAPESENMAHLMTEEEVLHAYDRAAEAWNWFTRKPLPHGEEKLSIKGETYWKVQSPRFSSKEDLRGHLLWLFSPELTDRLLQEEDRTPPYLEDQNSLYVWDGLGGNQDLTKGSRQIQVEKENDEAYSVNITVDLLDSDGMTVVGLEFWSFPYELTDGRWVFTDFDGID